MTRWIPFLVLALATGGCLADPDDAADTDADAAETADDGHTDPASDPIDVTVSKTDRWGRDGVLEAEEPMQGVGWSVALDGNTAIVGARHDRAALAFDRVGDQWARPVTLRGTGPAGDEFGTAVAVQGDTAVVGAFGDDTAATDAGAIYVFTRTDGTWRRTAKLTAPDAARGDRFGFAVALDRNRIVVGADMADAPSRPDAGAAYVFERDGSGWELEQKIVTDTPYARQFVGRSVVIDNRWIVLGAPSAVNSGLAYVFRRGALSSRWHQRDELRVFEEFAEEFGHSVAIRGSTILVGDYQARARGAVYVFTASDSDWSHRATLVASDEYDDGFGRSVALAAGVAVVGAPHEGPDDRGAAYVFTGSDDRWTRRARLNTGDGDQGALFGFSVAASGDLVLAGAHGDDRGDATGAGHVFLRY